MKKWLWIGLPIVLLGLLVVWRFKTKSAETPGGAGGPAASGGGGARGGGAGAGGAGGAGRAPTVQVTEAKAGEIETILETVGSLESPNKALISPKSTGRILSIDAREGDRVTMGQVLVRIDPSDIEGQVAQAQSSVAEARARLAQAQLGQGPSQAGIAGQIAQQTAALASAQANYTQVQRSYDSQVGAANSDVTDNEAKVRSAQSSVKSAQAGLSRDNATLQNLIAKRNRAEELYQGGYISLAALEDARTAVTEQQEVLKVSQSQVDSAQQGVISANAQLSASKDQLNIAKRKGTADVAVAKAQVQQAQANLKVANANKANNPAYQENLAALKAGVNAAQAELSQALSKRSETQLKAPLSGLVTERNADTGSLASPGQSVLVVQSTDWLYVRTSIPVSVSAKVGVGQTAKVTVDALPGQTFQGKISNVNGAADPQSRQVTALVRLENPDGKLRPGMFGHVIIVTGKVDAQVTVPREAIRTTPQGPTIAVIDDQRRAHVRSVKLGVQSDTTAEVIEGVKPGEKVVVLSYDVLREGQSVMLPGDRPAGAGGGGAGGAGGRGTGGQGGQGRGRRGQGQGQSQGAGNAGG